MNIEIFWSLYFLRIFGFCWNFFLCFFFFYSRVFYFCFFVLLFCCFVCYCFQRRCYFSFRNFGYCYLFECKFFYLILYCLDIDFDFFCLVELSLLSFFYYCFQSYMIYNIFLIGCCYQNFSIIVCDDLFLFYYYSFFYRYYYQ